ncbi:translation initiation factor IF-2 [Prunus yedoensis var. nudiflora]|uniref:Translation initiation factor IF-2 n=1 Tax=Prunus yedoensis var. nudiflora TaxID=2094558 RepID=A0A314YD61_PRUYE|nr:translation initiation factor IF-2 [Prunus yedoensis var. nudiflora]
MRGGTAIGIGRKLTNPSSLSISKQTLIPFSTSSNSGGGRGRGRGGPFPPTPARFDFTPHLASLVNQTPTTPNLTRPVGAGTRPWPRQTLAYLLFLRLCHQTQFRSWSWPAGSSSIHP